MSSESRHFDRRALHFEKNSNWVLAPKNLERIESFIRAVDSTRLGTALDLGSGTGALVPILTRLAERVVAFDISLGMIKNASTRAENVVCGTSEQLPFRSNCFDLVVARQSLHYMKLSEVAREVERTLSLGGCFVAVQIVSPEGVSRQWYELLCRVRQPQRRETFCQDDLRNIFSGNGTFLVGESRWLDRTSLKSLVLQTSGAVPKEFVIEHFKDAPAQVAKDLHFVSDTAGDIHYDRHWALAAFRRIE